MLVTLDSSLRKPLYVQIRDQIRDRILNGGLKPGDRLEPSRELAHQPGSASDHGGQRLCRP